MTFQHVNRMVGVFRGLHTYGMAGALRGLVVAFLVGAAVTADAPNTHGQIKGYQKISDTEGGFGGGLDDNERFGNAQASLGDLDSDGVNDVVVGAYFDGYFPPLPGPGAVWMLFLNNDGTVKSHVKITQNKGGFMGSLDPWDEFGISTASLGDLDGDGVTDLAVGARSDDDGGENRGAVWMLFLNSNGTVKSHQKISDTEGGFTGTLDDQDGFGGSLAWLGDIDGNGLGELAVGAYQDDDGGHNRGAVWILSVTDSGIVQSHWKISDTQGGFTGTLDDSDKFGNAVTKVPDLDGDGVADLMVGAHLDDDGGENTGAAWMLFLKSDGSVKSHQKISAIEGGFTGAIEGFDNFGVGLGWLGDIDNDGLPEVAVGAIGDDDGGNNRGAVWIVTLNPDGTTNSHIKISDTHGGFTGVLDDDDNFGANPVSMGDLDNDGKSDLALGAAGDDDGGDRRGAMWILFLSPCIVQPTNIDVDTVEVGDFIDTDFTITNTGSESITGNVTESCPDYSIISGGGPFTLAPSETLVVTIRFEPSAAGTHDCTISTEVCADVYVTGVAIEAPLPEISSISDVGNDQGRQVRISFSRSGLDTQGSPTPVLQYEAFRRIDPLPSLSVGEAMRSRELPLTRHPRDVADAGMISDAAALLLGWEFVGAIPAHGDMEYHMIAPTLADSTADDGIHWSVFFIRAATADPLTYFDSPPDSGYSVDNLAPNVPQNISVSYTPGSGNQLQWDPCEDPDFRYFNIYRGPTRFFEPGPQNLVHQTTDVEWVDPVNGGTAHHYKITAVDFAGNESEPGLAIWVTGIEDSKIPEAYALFQNYPNPFNPSTLIRYDVPGHGGIVTLKIYDVGGQLVRTLVDGYRGAGEKSVIWEGENDRGEKVGSGVYFYRLTAGNRTFTKKMVLLK